MKRPLPRSIRFTLLSASLFLTSCGGGTQPGSTPDKSSLPAASVRGGFASLPPNTGGTTGKVGDVSISIRFTVTLSAQPNGIATVDYQAVNGLGDSGAKGAIDYSKSANTLTFQPGEQTKVVDVPIIGGGKRHPYTNPTDKYFYLQLQNPSANITLGAARAMGTIMYAPGLNDTGIVTCATLSAKGLPCASTVVGTDQYPVQDAQFGRDVIAAAGLLNKVGAGAGAFDFTRFDIQGKALPDQSAPYDTTPWYCVRDNVTGLVWEVKTPDNSGTDPMHYGGSTYTWFQAGNTTIPDEGTPGGSGTCNINSCDTSDYIAAVNGKGYCGYTNWRLPTANELQSLVDYGNANGPAIDTGVFPNTQAGPYWAASLSADQTGNTAWAANFSDGAVVIRPTGTPAHIRLVHTLK